MSKRWSAVVLSVAAVAFGLLLASASSAQETPGPQGAKGKGGKKGKAKGPSMPAPRNRDGRVTLGPGEGQNGFWGGGGSITGRGGASLPTNLIPKHQTTEITKDRTSSAD